MMRGMPPTHATAGTVHGPTKLHFQTARPLREPHIVLPLHWFRVAEVLNMKMEENKLWG